jgi:hypothetical protein
VYLYRRGTGWPNYTPRNWVPHFPLLTTRRAMVEVFHPTPTLCWLLESTDSQSASLSWYKATLWNPRSISISFPWKLFSHSCKLFIVWHSHWREGGSLIYSCCWASPAQCFSGLNRAWFMPIFYWIHFEVPPKCRARSLHLFAQE